MVSNFRLLAEQVSCSGKLSMKTFKKIEAGSHYSIEVNKLYKELIESASHQVLYIKIKNSQMQSNSHKRNRWHTELAVQCITKRSTTKVPV